MDSKKRYILKIYDTHLGGEYEFDSDNFSIDSEKGLFISDSLGVQPNGQERHSIKIWTGFDNWEEFLTAVKKDG